VRGALLLSFLLACASAQAAGKNHEVAIEGMKFVPERLEVAVGDTVTWTNKDIVPHTVTAKAARIESGDLAQGKRYRLVVKKKGQIDYVCRLHPGMKAGLVAK